LQNVNKPWVGGAQTLRHYISKSHNDYASEKITVWCLVLCKLPEEPVTLPNQADDCIEPLYFTINYQSTYCWYSYSGWLWFDGIFNTHDAFAVV